MRKPSLTDALAKKDQSAPVPEDPAAASRPKDTRITTTMRISPEGLEALKIIAAGKRVRVNDLILEGVEHVLALNGRKMQLRK